MMTIGIIGDQAGRCEPEKDRQVIRVAVRRCGCLNRNRHINRRGCGRGRSGAGFRRRHNLGERFRKRVLRKLEPGRRQHAH